METTMDRPASRRPSSAEPALASEREYGGFAAFHQKFGLSRATAYRLEKKGHIRFVKVGGRTLIDFASVRAFLAQA
ncbi:helix-turn-helix domain-containing protein [Roseomonas marmotae]|uniref:Helix-turn-helix domain-containing protein n=1 Tax=Roseomonas marmotae TaxID=2768161 RepID=A0ABS3K7B0_9PROT|nr:helix-turn-helix domain-containing protein [Roseomonas marmotae]MBO1073363.1 helix-turn-helix domain-containing protein [Roseomonas marmotae]